MSQGGRDHRHWGWDVELVTDRVAHLVSLSLLIVDALQSPDSGPITNAHTLPTTSWEVGNEWAAPLLRNTCAYTVKGTKSKIRRTRLPTRLPDAFIAF